MVGCFGTLIFEVSSDKVLTFDNFTHKVAARYAKHELINSPVVLEYLGEDTQKITLSIILTATLGVNPGYEIKRIQELVLNGDAEWLIIGNEVVGESRFVITEASTRAISYDGEGHVLVAQLDLTFESYVASLEIF